MKKIIDGKTYNVNTATMVAQWDNGRVTDNLYYVQETLYKTRKGTFFLLGEGGAGTAYSKDLPDGWTAGSWAIIPMTANEVRKWSERRGVTLS